MRLKDILERADSKNYVNRVLAHHLGIDPKINNDQFRWETEIARSYLFVIEIVFNDLDTIKSNISSDTYQNAVKNFLRSTADDGHLVYHKRAKEDNKTGFEGGILYRARSVTVPPITMETVEHTYMGMTLQYPKKVSYGSGLEIQIDESQNFTNCFAFYKYLQTAMRSNKREVFALNNIGASDAINEGGSVYDENYEMYDFIGVTGAPNLFFKGIEDPKNDDKQTIYPGRSYQQHSYKNYIFDIIIHPIPYNGVISRSGGQSDTNNDSFEESLKRSQKIPKIYFHNCFVTGLTPGQLSYDSNEAFTTSVTLSYDWYEFIRTDTEDAKQVNEKSMTIDIFNAPITALIRTNDQQYNASLFTLTQDERKDLLEGKTDSGIKYKDAEIATQLELRGVAKDEINAFLEGKLSEVKIRTESPEIIKLQKSLDLDPKDGQFSSSEALLNGKKIFDDNGVFQLDVSNENFIDINTQLVKQSGLTSTAAEANFINSANKTDLRSATEVARLDAEIRVSTQKILSANPNLTEDQLSSEIKNIYKEAKRVSSNTSDTENTFIERASEKGKEAEIIARNLVILSKNDSYNLEDRISNNQKLLTTFLPNSELPDSEYTFNTYDIKDNNLTAETQIRFLNTKQSAEYQKALSEIEIKDRLSKAEIDNLANNYNVPNGSVPTTDAEYTAQRALQRIKAGNGTPVDYSIVESNKPIELIESLNSKPKLDALKVDTEKFEVKSVNQQVSTQQFKQPFKIVTEYDQAVINFKSAESRFINEQNAMNLQIFKEAKRRLELLQATRKTNSDYLVTPNNQVDYKAQRESLQQQDVINKNNAKNITSEWLNDSNNQLKTYSDEPEILP